jgi:hypothetical protein
MRYRSIALFSALAIIMSGAPVFSADDFLTVAERNDFRITSSYSETVDFYERLEDASPFAKMTVFGQTPQRRDLHCLIVSADKAFTPEAAKRTGKVTILIQNGIHSGEIDGKDASMILLREILISKERASLLDSVIILMIPIFNADGHENNDRYTRSNQYGPDNAGFRTTAQRYNLNRDYMKIDSPEMRAWVKLWTTWMPDFFIDNHVTDGHDWQYVLTYTMPWHPNAASQVRDWTNSVFDPYFIPRCTELGFPPFPYAFPLRDHPNKGIGTFVDIPRFSTGYAALWNRPGLLIEMHSLKEYKPRVMGNHAAMVAVLEVLNRQSSGLKKAITAADAELTSGALASQPLTYEATGDSTFETVLNYRVAMDSSAVTGGQYARWDHGQPQTDTVPYFGSFRAKKSVVPPRAYLIPREWSEIIDRLRWHGVKMDTLTSAATLSVELYQLDSVKFAGESFEGRVGVSYKTAVRDTTLTYPAGTVVVNTRQPAGKVAMQALEPDGPDSFLSWGFLNTILEQKEYGEGYVIDPLADSLYAHNAEIRADFDARLASDTSFAKSTSAKRDFFYKRSRFAEGGLNWYPITRVTIDLPKTLPWRND